MNSALSCSYHPVSLPIYNSMALNIYCTHCLYFFTPHVFFSWLQSVLILIIPRKQLSNFHIAKSSGHFSFLSLFYLTLLANWACLETFFVWLWGCHFLLVFLLPLTISSIFFSRFSVFLGPQVLEFLKAFFFLFFLSSGWSHTATSFTTYILITPNFISWTKSCVLVFRFLYPAIYLSSLQGNGHHKFNICMNSVSFLPKLTSSPVFLTN